MNELGISSTILNVDRASWWILDWLRYVNDNPQYMMAPND